MDFESARLTHPDCNNTATTRFHQHPIGQMVSKTGLADYSPKDKHWNKHRANVDSVSAIYATAQDFERYAERMEECSGWLSFGWATDTSTGESKLKLKKSNFCRVRYCPVCQWRRSMMWKARFMKALPRIVEEFPKSRWLFLTLTLKNCDIEDLGNTLTVMNKAWNKLIKRKELNPIQGWIRTTEVTRKKEDRTAHPHFHVLLMVPPSWFAGKYYVKQKRWVELWGESLGVNYDPGANIKTVKPRNGKDKALGDLTTIELLEGAVKDTLKYATKADDMMVDRQWFLELTRQTHKKRFMATGGALKGIFKVGEETNDDLIHGDEDGLDLDEDGGSMRFIWEKQRKQYHKKQDGGFND